MGRFCMFREGGNRNAKTLGVVLMCAGVLLLLLSVPSWLWASTFGVVLISVGYLIWRFG